MMLKFIHSVYNINTSYSRTFIRHSALFINGMKATDTFVHIIPHIDFQERIKHREDLQNELARRKSSIDLNKLENLWAFYKDLQSKKDSLKKKREEIYNEISAYMKTNPGANEVEGLRNKLNLIKDNIKKIQPPLWTAEEMAILEILKLPNVLHPLTPEVENKILFENYSAPTHSKNHLDIGKKLNLLEFTKNENYYLKGDGAIFELGAKFYFSDILKKNKFVQFSNTDFVKSIIIEGCGDDHTDSDATFLLHHDEESQMNIDSRLHLTGGGSTYSFFAYHAKNVINNRMLPIKYFAMGRQYKPSPDGEDCLFHVSQSSVIEVFEVGKTAEEVNSLVEELIAIVKDCYNQLGYHFRLSILSPDKLCISESLRISIEMYSTSLKTYVEVGHISVSGDFISKRLLLTYYSDDKQNHYPHVISGTVLHVPKLLGCVLEQDSDFFIPEPFKVHNWKM